MLEHHEMSEEIVPPQFDSINDMRSVSNSCFSKKNNVVSWTYENQLGNSLVKVMKTKQFEKLEGKSGILLNKNLEQLKYTERMGFQSLVHANLGILSKYFLKLPTTFNNFYSIIGSCFTSPKFKNIPFFPSLPSQPFVFCIPIDHQQHNLNTMSSKSRTPTTKHNMSSEPKGTNI